MFQSDMKEKREEVVTIKDATMEDVEQLVAYVYSGTTEEPYDRFKDLLALADKYQVPELVKFCSFKVADSLSEENALELGIYGETHNANILVEMCAQFIAANMKNSLDDDDWMERIKGSPKLTLEIVKVMRDNAKMSEDVKSVVMTIKRMIENQADTNDNITLNIDSIYSECVEWDDLFVREALDMALRELRGLNYIRFHPSCSIIMIEPYWKL